MVMLTTEKDIKQKKATTTRKPGTDESKHAENTCEAGKQYRLLT